MFCWNVRAFVVIMSLAIYIDDGCYNEDIALYNDVCELS